MSPEEYNSKQLEKGLIQSTHITTLTKLWQEEHNLEADGKCGPKTIANIEIEIFGEASLLGLEALKIATENIGKGEEGGNNSGPFVEMLHGKEFDEDNDDDGAWCAAFVSWCSELACKKMGIQMPFKRSGGAKALYKRISKAGSIVDDPLPGDVVCWDRGKKGSWQGHIGFVESCQGGILYTVEGNVGRYPSLVRNFQHDLSRENRLIGFARMP